MDVNVPELPSSLLELSIDLLAVVDRRCFAQVNARWEERLGWTPGELIGRPFTDLVHRDDVAATAALYEGAEARPVSGFANRWRHKDGSWRWLLWESRELAEGRWLCAARDITSEREALAERQGLVDELRALQRVATAVAGGATPEEVCSKVSAEAGRLLCADAAAVIKVLPGGRVELVGGWIRRGVTPPIRPGAVLDVREQVDLQSLFDAEGPHRVDDASAEGPITRSFGFGSSLTSRILVEGRDWGFLMLVHGRERGFPPQADAQLADFASLTALAVANADARAELERRALTDSLTTLMNHQAFHDRLRGEVERAHRHGRQLTLAVLDLDHFKAINDTLGHRAGDRALSEVAGTLRANRRLGDLVGRIGGDELALILTDCGAEDARGMLERLREQIAAIEMPDGQTLTFSAGVCDLTAAATAEELFRRADDALYRSKRAGRSRTTTALPVPGEDAGAA